MKRWSGPVVAVLLAAGTFAAVALAARTCLKLKNPEVGVSTGTARSGEDRCERKRRVTVRHDEDRDGYDRSDF